MGQRFECCLQLNNPPQSLMFTVTGHAIHICHSCLLTHFVMKRKEVAELCLVKVSDEFGLPVIVLKGKACSICDKIVFLIGSSQNCKLVNTLNVDSSGISSCCWQPRQVFSSMCKFWKRLFALQPFSQFCRFGTQNPTFFTFNYLVAKQIKF